MAARDRHDWLAMFPFLALGAVGAALFTFAAYLQWHGLAVDVGHQQSAAQEVFFGTEYRNPDVARFIIPIELITGLFFVLIALLFVGFGQVLGRAFDAYPNRVLGYTLNIGGSLAGIVGFSILSFAQAPPIVWFFVCFSGVAYLLWQSQRLTWLRSIALGISLLLVAVPVYSVVHPGAELRWSPYYAVTYDKPRGNLVVNTIAHQAIVPFEYSGAPYSLIYLLQRNSGGRPLGDVLIIGAGTGNDVAHALRYGARRIDAVEIDPVIQDLGSRNHPDRPYQDPRVFRYLDDGRHFIRTTGRKYDLVVYGMVDSLILHSSYSNIRLESYLFTQQAFSDVHRALRPNGLFVMYNFLRQGWIVDRIAAMAQETFGRPPVVLTLPYQKSLGPNDVPGFTVVIAGNNEAISAAFRQYGTFWLNKVPTQNLGVNGFRLQPRPDTPPMEQRQWVKIGRTSLVIEPTALQKASDDWPFLYLRGKLLPDLTARSLLLMGLLAGSMIYIFLPKGSARLHSRMFFLGAAFMLLETKAVVQLALLFGSTWFVNSFVFFTILSLILLANVYVLKAPGSRLAWYYAGLVVLLLANVLAPLDVFLRSGFLWRYVAPCALVLGPIFFASIIFAKTFRETTNPDQAFGSNIAGSVIGGLTEALSLLLGFRDVLLVAMVFYLLSAWMPYAGRSVRARAGTVPELWAPK
ncbi:MAG TPA: hypothetical protein VJT33_04000 [bacterium]|nr:hypothetical protein [bacterium]